MLKACTRMRAYFVLYSADPDDCRLLVLVVAAKDLEDQDFCANTNRYLVTDLDGVRKRTSYGMVSRGGSQPVFEEFFTHKVKFAQWVSGTLRVQVRVCICPNVIEKAC